MERYTLFDLLSAITLKSMFSDLWTDIGLPPGHNRDNISSNNFTERAFKKFDEIFLENRANKS